MKQLLAVSTQQKRSGEWNALKTAIRIDQKPLLLWPFSINNYFCCSIFNCNLPKPALRPPKKLSLQMSFLKDSAATFKLKLIRLSEALSAPAGARSVVATRPRDALASAPRASPPVSIALDQFISPQLRAARKAKIKGESRSCIFIFSLLEGNWFPRIYFGSCNTQGRICVTRATCRWR